MNIRTNQPGRGRSLHSRARTALGAGVASILVLAGVALVGVLPASAAPTATGITITTQPTPGSAFLNENISMGVTLGGSPTSGAGGDVVTITTPTAGCTVGGTDSFTYSGTNPMTLDGIKFTAGTSCALTATDNGFTATSSPLTTLTAFTTASKIAFKTAPPTSTQADTALTTFTVATEDQYGNVVASGAGSADSVEIVSSCTLGGTVAAAESAGVATFSALTLNTVGSCSITAEDTTAPDTAFTVTSAAITVNAGAPTHVAFKVAPPATELSINTALTSFTVAVEDVANNVDLTGTGATDSISVSSPCTLGGTDTATAIAGVATFSAVTFTETGSCVVTATDATRTLTVATATIVVGEAQTSLTITTLSGYRDSPLTLATSGGSGTGAVTFSVVNGTATGCLITGNALSATSAGTCIVTAAKAAASPYAPAVSAATTVNISSAPKALHVVGIISKGKTATATITGYNFYGQPKIVSNVAGFSVKVTHDTGKTLTLIVKVTGNSKVGVHVMTLTFANGDKTSVKYSLH